MQPTCVTPGYRSWQAMKARCYNPNNNRYKSYGARGIRVCQRWLESYKNFYEDMGQKPARHQLDRRDVNGDYCKENCRWLDIRLQARNTTFNRRLRFRGTTKCLAEWAESLGISQSALQSRLDRYGWSIDEALAKPLTPPNRKRNAILVRIGRRTMNVSEWCRRYGIRQSTVWMRVHKSGWDIKRALTTPVISRG